MQNRYRFKVIFVGPPGVGKTSIIKVATGGTWRYEYISTIGFSIYVLKRNYENCSIEILIYDLGGQERFRTIHKSFYPGTHVTVFCYDVSDPDSIKELPSWKDDRDLYIGRPAIYNVLVGNKIDLEKRISDEEGEATATRLGCHKLVLTSAKSGENIGYLFDIIFEALHSYIENTLKTVVLENAG